MPVSSGSGTPSLEPSMHGDDQEYIGTRAKDLADRNVNKPRSLISLIVHQMCIARGVTRPSRFFFWEVARARLSICMAGAW